MDILTVNKYSESINILTANGDSDNGSPESMDICVNEDSDSLIEILVHTLKVDFYIVNFSLLF